MMKLADFLEYREFLRAFYEERKKRESWFSIRFIGGKVGMDPALVLKVFQGKRHIAEQYIPAFCRLCGLDKQDSKYFEALVAFNKARSDREAKKAFQRVLSLRGFKSREIEKQQYEFYRKWYYNAVRALLSIMPRPVSARKIGMCLSPKITTRDAKEALALLEKVQLIEKRDDGSYVPKDRFITTGKSWRSIAIRDFQKESMRLGMESLDRHDKEVRDISTVTVTIEKDRLDEARERIREFRKSIMQMASKKAKRVYQLNIQLFPLTETVKGGEQDD
jgi:uncharacterized protein (TIGR02147 family)